MDGVADTRHVIAWSGNADQPGRVVVRHLVQIVCFPVSKQLPAEKPSQSASEEWRTSILPWESVFVRPAEAATGIADMAIVPSGLRCFAPFKELCPLRRSAAIPVTPQRYFLPAGHAKQGATPQGVFDWARSSQSGVWGTPTNASENPKGYSDALLAYVNVAHKI